MKSMFSLLITLLMAACALAPAVGTATEKAANKALLDKAVGLYQQGRHDEARALFEQAAAQGQMKAPRYLGLMYLNGEGVAKNPRRAFVEFKRAADKGDITGQYWLGYLYEHGIGTGKAVQQAFSWYRQSARDRIDHVTAPAMVALGRFYERGIAVAAGKTEAVAWYRKAASAGDAEAQTALRRFGLFW